MNKFLFYGFFGLCGLLLCNTGEAQSYIVINAVEEPFQTAENQGVWDKTKEITADAWDGTKEVTSDVWDGTKKVTSDVWDGTKNVASDIKDGITGDDTADLHKETSENKSAAEN